MDAVIAVDVGSTNIARARRIREKGFAAIYIRAAQIMMKSLQSLQLANWTGPPLLLVRPAVWSYGLFSFAHVDRVIEQARSIALSADREIVDVIPQEFTVDGQDGIINPLGFLGMRLEAAVHLVSSPITARQNVISSVNRAGILVLDTVLEHWAAAEAALTEDEKEYGTALVDIGGETTNLAIYHRGAVQHTAVLPIGGSHFTSDIAVGLRTPIPEAERIKRARDGQNDRVGIGIGAHRLIQGSDGWQVWKHTTRELWSVKELSQPHPMRFG